MKPRALILFANGTNRDQDAGTALACAGAEPVTMPLTELREGRVDWDGYQMLVIPGGFSYADALGAGKLLALDLIHYFRDEVNAFVAVGKPVIGICNGFQALVKSGILPETNRNGKSSRATLTFNSGNRFECRWVNLKPISKTSLWTRDLNEVIDCPVAHGEGNFQTQEPKLAADLFDNEQVAFVYADPEGQTAAGKYPLNPNGSVMDIAGICNQRGNVLGLMPHPENHIFPFQSPDRYHRTGHYGLALFENGVRYAQESAGG